MNLCRFFISQKRPQRRERTSGFVLLTVLMLVALGAVLLTRYSMQSLRLAAQAQRSRNEFSDRWAQWSALQIGMVRAQKILQVQSQNGIPVTSAEVPISIGDQTWYVRVVDLDAAVNVNTVANVAGATGVRRLMSNDFVAFGRRPISAFQSDRTGQAQPRLVFDSWGSLLQLDSTSTGSDTGTALQELHQYVTCWGSGQLNIRCCSDKSLSVLGTAIARKGLLDTVKRERSSNPKAPLKDIIAKAARGNEDADLLRSLLRESSTSWCVTVSREDGSTDLLLIRESGFGQFSDRTTLMALK